MPQPYEWITESVKRDGLLRIGRASFEQAFEKFWPEVLAALKAAVEAYNAEIIMKASVLPPVRLTSKNHTIQIVNARDRIVIGTIAADLKNGEISARAVASKTSTSVYLAFNSKDESAFAYSGEKGAKIEYAALSRTLLQPILFENLVMDPLTIRPGFFRK